MTPMKMYERINLRRTRHNNRRLIWTKRRHANTPTAIASATVAILLAMRTASGKVPAARQIAGKGNETLCSDCPLACQHLGQLVSSELKDGAAPPRQAHPIEILAAAYGIA